MVDTLLWGGSGRKPVRVRVSPTAQNHHMRKFQMKLPLFFWRVFGESLRFCGWIRRGTSEKHHRSKKSLFYLTMVSDLGIWRRILIPSFQKCGLSCNDGHELRFLPIGSFNWSPIRSRLLFLKGGSCAISAKSDTVSSSAIALKCAASQKMCIFTSY